MWYVDTYSVDMYIMPDNTAPAAYEHYLREPRWRVPGLLHAGHTGDRRGVQGLCQ